MEKETMKDLILQVLTNEPKNASEIIELVGCETEYNKFCEVLTDLMVEQKVDWVVGGFVLSKENLLNNPAGHTAHNTKKDMKVQAYLKNHSKNEFYIKPLRKGYYAVIDGYDKSMASLEISEEAAINKMNELNQLRNGRI